jgi:hypothetical protein
LFSRLKGECHTHLRSRSFSRIGLSECRSALHSIRLLYCESRSCFYSLTFHRDCDGFGSTLTLIETSLHNIFAGYTPCVWNSTLVDVFDDGSRSVIFTLKNPYSLAPPKFPLLKGKRAISCLPGDGPTFGIGSDIRGMQFPQEPQCPDSGIDNCIKSKRLPFRNKRSFHFTANSTMITHDSDILESP